jgi:hypothetical protein
LNQTKCQTQKTAQKRSRLRMLKKIAVFSFIFLIFTAVGGLMVTIIQADNPAQTVETPEGYPPPPTYPPPTAYPGQPPTMTPDVRPPTAYPALIEDGPATAPTSAPIAGEASDPALSPTVINQIGGAPEAAPAAAAGANEGSRALLWIAFLAAAVLLGLAILLTTRLIGRRFR